MPPAGKRRQDDMLAGSVYNLLELSVSETPPTDRIAVHGSNGWGVNIGSAAFGAADAGHPVNNFTGRLLTEARVPDGSDTLAPGAIGTNKL